jgi:hypothetical protein
VSDWYKRNATRTSADRDSTTASATDAGDQDATGEGDAERKTERL